MNLLNAIEGLLSKQVTSKLASRIGGSEKQTESALGAAVPAMLSAMSNVASSGDQGADRLATALGRFDAGSLGKLADMVTQDSNKTLDQGDGLLASLFSGTVISGLSGAVSQFAGLDSKIVRKLLGYLAPLVMGTIAQQFKGRPVTSQGISAMFAEQKENISGALPAGFSLDGITGQADRDAAATQVATAAQYANLSTQQMGQSTEPMGSSRLKRLLPIVALALLALFAWRLYQSKPEGATGTSADAPPAAEHMIAKPVAPQPVEAAQMPTHLRATYAAATEALGSITDTGSAEAALPKLNELNAKLKGLVALWDKLPESGQSALAEITRNNLGKLTALVKPILTIPGTQEKLGPVLSEILLQLEALGGAA